MAWLHRHFVSRSSSPKNGTCRSSAHLLFQLCANATASTAKTFSIWNLFSIYVACLWVSKSMLSFPFLSVLRAFFIFFFVCFRNGIDMHLEWSQCNDKQRYKLHKNWAHKLLLALHDDDGNAILKWDPLSAFFVRRAVLHSIVRLINAFIRWFACTLVCFKPFACFSHSHLFSFEKINNFIFFCVQIVHWVSSSSAQQANKSNKSNGNRFCYSNWIHNSQREWIRCSVRVDSTSISSFAYP